MVGAVATTGESSSSFHSYVSSLTSSGRAVRANPDGSHDGLALITFSLNDCQAASYDPNVELRFPRNVTRFLEGKTHTQGP
jgi:hypothetical protein